MFFAKRLFIVAFSNLFRKQFAISNGEWSLKPNRKKNKKIDIKIKKTTNEKTIKPEEFGREERTRGGRKKAPPTPFLRPVVYSTAALSKPTHRERVRTLGGTERQIRSQVRHVRTNYAFFRENANGCTGRPGKCFFFIFFSNSMVLTNFAHRFYAVSGGLFRRTLSIFITCY